MNTRLLEYIYAALLAALLVFLVACSDSSDGVPALPPEDPTEIKVMSYNLRYGDIGLLIEENTRKDRLVASIISHRPDFLGVQEANEPWMEILPAELSDYDFVGVGRDDGEAEGERSAIFYLKEKYFAFLYYSIAHLIKSN